MSLGRESRHLDHLARRHRARQGQVHEVAAFDAPLPVEQLAAEADAARPWRGRMRPGRAACVLEPDRVRSLSAGTAPRAARPGPGSPCASPTCSRQGRNQKSPGGSNPETRVGCRCGLTGRHPACTQRGRLRSGEAAPKRREGESKPALHPRDAHRASPISFVKTSPRHGPVRLWRMSSGLRAGVRSSLTTWV